MAMAGTGIMNTGQTKAYYGASGIAGVAGTSGGHYEQTKPLPSGQGGPVNYGASPSKNDHIQSSV